MLEQKMNFEQSWGGGNPNLLDNPDFGINQKQQTEYDQYNGYTVDRWRIEFSEGGSKLRVIRTGIELIPANGGWILLGQLLEGIDKISGPVTLSFLLDDQLLSATFHLDPSLDYLYHYAEFGDYVLGIKGKDVSRVSVSYSGSAPARLRAAKLELGPVQTLAHKAGDTWVLNDPPPDPALELAKCQRYQMVYRCPESGYGHIAYVMKSQEGIWYGFLHLPNPLRTKPGVRVTDGEPILNIFNAVHSVSDWGVLSLTGNHVLIHVSSTSDAPVGTWAMLQTTNSPAKLILDANL